MARGRAPWVRRIATALVILLLLGAGATGVFWWKFLRAGDQRELTTAEARFKYGSLGGELIAGIPYPIFFVLPRVFPDLVEQYATRGYGPEKPGYGGYGAFGLAWEQGERLPVGLSIRRLGYDRITVNCALCHTSTWRMSAADDPHIVPGGPGHTVNVQGLLRFLFAASHDARFTAARLLPEMAVHFPLDGIDWGLYALVLIPKTRLALHLAERELGWMNDKTAWGPGRDDAFNLPKFIITRQPWDASVSNTDFPALWRLANRDGGLVHAGGQAKTVYAVTATSAFGAGSLPDGDFRARNERIVDFIRTLEPPPFPAPVDRTLVTQGQEIFAARCAACHAVGGARTGSAIPVDEIGTDPEHVRAWTQSDADRMNFATGALGMAGADLQGAQGYVARPLVGVWLLGPYLHNGSVPTVWDLLSPATRRPTRFFRGHDVIDPVRLGFVSVGPEAQANGFAFDTTLQGNGNQGHLYGTELPDEQKRALIEYLKTL